MSWPTRRGWRLGSGLVLFTYVALHLANHALGLVSVAASDDRERVLVKVKKSAGAGDESEARVALAAIARSENTAIAPRAPMAPANAPAARLLNVMMSVTIPKSPARMRPRMWSGARRCRP